MNPRIVPLVLLLLLVAVQAQLWTGRGSVVHVQEMKEKIAVQKQANDRARQENERLASRTTAWYPGIGIRSDAATSSASPVSVIAPPGRGQAASRAVRSPTSTAVAAVISSQ